MTRRQHSVSSWRLLLRALSYHRGQTIAVALVTALITAGAVFAPWYTQMVDDTVTQDAFAVGEPGSTLRLTGPDDAQLLDDAARGHRRAIRRAGRRAARRHALAVDQPQPPRRGRNDLAARHLRPPRVHSRAACPEPPSTDAKAVPAAVSEADAKMYNVSVGDVLPELNSAYSAVDFEVTGIYRLQDPGDPYWFEVLPDRALGVAADLEIPVADLFVVSQSGVVFGTERRRANAYVDDNETAHPALPGLPRPAGRRGRGHQ